MPLFPEARIVCPHCQGKLRLISLSLRDRKRRHLGRSWVAECERCSRETVVNPDAYLEAAARTFLKRLKGIKPEDKAKLRTAIRRARSVIRYY